MEREGREPNLICNDPVGLHLRLPAEQQRAEDPPGSVQTPAGDECGAIDSGGDDSNFLADICALSLSLLSLSPSHLHPTSLPFSLCQAGWSRRRIINVQESWMWFHVRVCVQDLALLGPVETRTSLDVSVRTASQM